VIVVMKKMLMMVTVVQMVDNWILKQWSLSTTPFIHRSILPYHNHHSPLST
jgi:hypothetical protein